MIVTIRPETPEDEQDIHDVTIAAFLNAAHRDGTEQFVVRALRAAGALTISLVAESDGVVTGHIAISPVAISDGSTGWYGTGPLSVHPDQQRSGIGSLLLNDALGRLRAMGAAGCVLLGDPAYYVRFGFAPDARLVLAVVPPQYFQVLPFGDSVPAGFVNYHEAFSAVE